MKLFPFILLSVLLAANQSLANVFGLFPSGADSKSSAIESAIDSKEPATLLYNPAALSQSQAGIHAELGLGKLLYRYEHPQFDPVNIKVVSPITSLGWKNNSEGSNFSWGLAFLPTSLAKLDIKGLPRRIEGKPESLNISTTRKQFHIPIGGSWTPVSDNPFTLGASLIYTYDERTLKADSLVDGAKLVDLTAKGQFFRPEIGLTDRFVLGQENKSTLDVGLSYVHGLKKAYKGQTTLAVVANPFDTETVDYDPAILATGLRWTFREFSTSLNVNRIFGQAGGSVIRDGLNRNTTSADVRDVNQYGMKLSYDLDKKQSVSVAYAYLPTIWGAGFYQKTDDGSAVHELGHIFGTFNAMPVRNQAITYVTTLGGWKLNNTFFRTAGKQTIDSSGDNPGHYQLEFISLTSGVTKSF